LNLYYYLPTRRKQDSLQQLISKLQYETSFELLSFFDIIIIRSIECLKFFCIFIQTFSPFFSTQSKWCANSHWAVPCLPFLASPFYLPTMISPLTIVKKQHSIIPNPRQLSQNGKMSSRLISTQRRLSPNLIHILPIPISPHDQIPNRRARYHLQQFQCRSTNPLGLWRIGRGCKAHLRIGIFFVVVRL